MAEGRVKIFSVPNSVQTAGMGSVKLSTGQGREEARNTTDGTGSGEGRR